MAEREGLSERYQRAQLPLAYLSSKIVEAVANGTISADVTVTKVGSALPIGWAKQEGQLLRGAAPPSGAVPRGLAPGSAYVEQ
jgi:hypothetical protein